MQSRVGFRILEPGDVLDADTKPFGDVLTAQSSVLTRPNEVGFECVPVGRQLGGERTTSRLRSPPPQQTRNQVQEIHGHVPLRPDSNNGIRRKPLSFNPPNVCLNGPDSA